MKLVVAAVVAVLVAPSSALGAERQVAMQYTAFQPARLLALTGDTVKWTNRDTALHNVTATTFPSSGDLGRDGTHQHEFAAPGRFDYRCTKHAGMTGIVSVAALHLSGPAFPVVYGRPVAFTGLAPANATVELHRVTAAGMEPVASATAASSGAFSISFAANLPGQYHATAGARSSGLVPLRVRPRVAVVTRRSGAAVYVNVSTNPAQVGASVVLQRRTSAGWARVASARLNSRSKATFRVVPRAAMTLRVQLRSIRGYSPTTSAPKTIRPW